MLPQNLLPLGAKRILTVFFLLFFFGNLSAQQKSVYGLKLFCTETGEGGEDEVYLEVAIDGAAAKRYPEGSGTYHSMNEGSAIATWYIPYTFTYTSVCVITVKEYDDGSGDDLIGSIILTSATPNNSASAALQAEGHNYTLSYSVWDASAAAVSSQQPFKFIFNGIRCLETTDDGEDEIYLMVSVDGKAAVRYPETGDKFYTMNERAQGELEQFWDDLVSASKKEYWLLPGSWNVNSSINIEIWEEDDGANPDDRLGLISVGLSDPDANTKGVEFSTEGHYYASYTKETLKDRPSNIQASFTLMNPDNGTRTDAVNDQKSEGACVAFSVTSAIASKVINSAISNSNNPTEERARLTDLSKAMFDASWFYSLRDPVDGVKTDGWQIYFALEKAKTNTIPFVNGNKNYGIRLSKWYYIDGDGVGPGIVTGFNYPEQLSVTKRITTSKLDLIREALQQKEVLLADFSVYEDFRAYVKTQKIYGGTIYYQGIDSKKGTSTGHAVMVTGFTYPDKTNNDPAYWEVQNSWGPKWGDNGFCKFATNSCGLDAEMYFPGDFYVCDLKGNRVTDEEAKRLINEAINGAIVKNGGTAASGLAAVGSNFVFIENYWKPNMKINVETTLTASARADGDWSAHWKIVPVPNESGLYYIENRWKSGRLHIENGTLEFSEIKNDAWSAHWKFRETSVGAFIIENRWKSDQKINIENGKLECSTIHDGANSAFWYLKIKTD